MFSITYRRRAAMRCHVQRPSKVTEHPRPECTLIGRRLPEAAVRRCDVCVWRSEWRLAPFGSFSRRKSRETVAETESGFSGVPSRVGEDQVEICPVVWPELATEFILPLPVGFNRGERRLRYLHHARPLRFRPLELQYLLGLGE